MNLPTNKTDAAIVVQMNVYYHQRTEYLYNLLLDITTGVSLVFSSVAFAALSDFLPINPGYKSVIIGMAALLVTALNAVVLSTGARWKADKHADLKRQWTLLLRKVQKTSGKDKSAIDDLLDEINLISSTELPPSNRRIDWAHDQALKAMGHETYGTSS